MSDTKLTQLKLRSGISDFTNLSEVDATKVVGLLDSGKIDVSHITALMVGNGAFYAQVTQALKLGIKVADGAKHTQGKVLDALSSQIEGADRIYFELFKKASSDGTIQQLSKDRVAIGEQNIKVARTIKDINDSNNEVWKVIARQSLIVLGMVAVAVIGASAARRSDTNDGSA